MCTIMAAIQAALGSLSPDALDTLPPGERLRRLFVAALTEQSKTAWNELLEYSSTLSVTDRQQLSSEPDVQHYVHRSLRYAESASSTDSHTDIVHALTALFPGVVEQCRKQSLSVDYHLPLRTRLPRAVGKRQVKKRVVSLDSGLAKLLTYSPAQIAATFQGPELQLRDLIPAASTVSSEMTLQSKTALAPSHHLHLTSSPPHHQHTVVPRPLLSPVYHSQVETEPCTATEVRKKVKFDDTSMTRKESKLHTAYDVIAAFATGSLQAGAESVYLNSSSSSPWNPYNLTVVSKTRATADHHLISKFGILHVQPGGSSDLQSFADWLRGAGLFSLCQQIPFFRQFLIRKMFRCWYRNVCYRQFIRLFSEVDHVGLRFFPEFHNAIDKLHSLNTELLSMSTHTLTPLGGYSADTLEKNSEEVEAKTRRLLQRYFKYCKRVVCEGINATRRRAEKLEEEKKHRPFVSDSPISVQVAENSELDHKLEVAQYRAGRLADFVCLAEQMTGTCLLEMARQSGRGWVRDTLHLSDNDDETHSSSSFDTDDRGTSITEEFSKSTEQINEVAFLTVQLKIGEKGGVVTEPCEDKIVQLLSSPLHSITALISSTSSTLTELPTPTPLHLTGVTGEGVKGDNVKMLLPTGRGQTYKPLIKALKGITGGTGSGSVPESSRARSQLEEVQTQGGSEAISKKVEYSTPHSPLTPQAMKQKLQQDPVYQSLSDSLQESLEGLRREISALCQCYKWLYQAHSLIAKCKRDKTTDMTAQHFEVVLEELHSALSQISRLPPLLPTSHSLVTISTVGVASQLEPQLRQAVTRLQRSLAGQAVETATRLLRDSLKHTQMLSCKRYDLEGFVQYAHSLRESQAFHAREVSHTQWVTDVHTTLRKYRIHNLEEDRETLQRLQGVWAEFEAKLEDGVQFVEKQTPLKAQGLQESILVLEEQLEKVLMSANVGDFVDPTATPHFLLTGLEFIQEQMSGIKSRLMELCKWEEAITGKHHKLSRMFHCFDVLYARQELWRYRRQFDSCDYDWSNVPFKKLDITYLEQKVCEWWKVCGQLEKSLPSTDPVLEQWREKVEMMHTNMGILQLLASRTIQTSHWHTIFAAFNEQYDAREGYSLHYFLDKDLGKFSDIISKVHCLASQQSRLREKFLWMEKQWEAKVIDLHQTSVDRYSFCLPPKSSQRQKTITFYDPSEAPAGPGPRAPEAGHDQLHTVRDGEKLRREIEAALLELNVMLSSPHLGALKAKVELLRSSLQQVSEIISLLLQCQDQWQDLLEVFLHIKPASRKSSGLQKLQSASTHFKEVMDSVHGDPRVSSLLSKRRGKKGVRDLQGPELRNKLTTILQYMREVMVKLGPRLDEAVCQWPRLGYLTPHQRLKALACRGDLLPIIPLINRVFPSIKTVHYLETSTTTNIDSSPGYQVTGVEGVSGEHLSLVLPLPLEQKTVVEWLAGLEQAVRFTLASRLTDCFGTLPLPLTGQPLGSEEGVMEWMKDHVEQNILLALDIHWSGRLRQACSDNRSTNLQATCSQLERALENAVQLLLRQTTQQLREEEEEEEGKNTHLITHTLRSVIICLRRKVDFTHSLMMASDVDALWLLHVHYTTVQRSVLVDHEPVGENLRSAVSGDSSATTSRASVSGSRISLASPGASNEASQSGCNSAPITSSPAPQSPPSVQAAGSSVSPYSTPRGQLHISSPLSCTVHAGRSSVGYGFEYYGPTAQIVMIPSLEAGVIDVANSFAEYSFPGVSGGHESQKTETVQVAAKLLGRHYYCYTCCHLTSTGLLLHLVHTALSSGSILSLEHTHTLPTPTQLSLRNYLNTLQSLLATSLITSTTADSPHLPSTQQSARSPPRPTSDIRHSHITSSRLDWYSPLPLSLPPPCSLDHMGHTVTGNPLFGCCVVLDPQRPSKLNRRGRLRGVACEMPDKRLVVEILLSSHGFSAAFHLSTALVTLTDHLHSQLSSRGLLFGLPWLQRVVPLAAQLLYTDSHYHQSEMAVELHAMSRAVVMVTTPQVPPDQTARLGDIVSRHLPHSELGGGASGEEVQLVKAVEEEMKERNLQIYQEFTTKIVQLHQSLGQYNSTILLGPRKSGISTCYRTLSAAYKRMGKPPTDIIVISPAAYSLEQLIGGYCTDESGSDQWTNGILTRLLLHLRASERLGAVESHWVVLDGPLTPTLLDTLTTLISGRGLCLPGMDRVTIPSTCRLILKPGHLPSLSPGLAGSCGLLHWSCDTLNHQMLVDSWLDRAPTQHDLSGMSISYLARVLETMVPESLEYLERVCTNHYGHLYSSHTQQRAPGAAETLSLLGLLSAMLERNCPTREGTTALSGYGSRSSSSLRSSVGGSVVSSRCGSAISQASSMAELSDHLPPLADDDNPTPDRAPSEMNFSFSPSNLDSVETQTLAILTFAFVWSIGAYVPFSEIDSFNEFALEQINDLPISVSFPDEGCVFDYYLDLNTYRFEPWSKRKGRLLPKQSGYISTPELSRVAYVVEVHLSYGHNVLLLGERGSGKTSLVEFLLQSSVPMTRFPITRATTSSQLHTALSNKVTEVTRVDKLRWGSRKIGLTGQSCLFFLDDLHLSCHGDLQDNHDPNCHPPPPSVPELVSFVSHHSCLFGFPDNTLCYTNNVRYIVSCGAGDQYTHLSQLLGSFHPVPLFPPTDQMLLSIFSSSLTTWFKRFPNAAIGEPETLAKALSVASVATYRSVCSRLCPSPIHPQWFLSQRQLMDVFKGLLLTPLDSKLKTLSTQFGLLNRRTTPSTAGKSSRKNTEKSARKSSSILPALGRKSTARHKVDQSVKLPPVKKPSENSLRNKIKSELKGKKQTHDSSEVQATLQRLVRLWCHENTRVYADRMTESRDRAWFVKLLETCIKYCFCGVGFERSASTATARGVRPGGGVRGRGVRGRGVSVAEQSVGLNITKLLSEGVRADVLQSLLPRDQGSSDEGAGQGGQLIPFNQVVMRGEDVTALIFCKLPAVRVSLSDIAATAEEGASSSDEEEEIEDKNRETLSENVYQELGDGQVLEAMEKHVHTYSVHCTRQNQDDISPAPDIILFQRATEHITRLCRAMIIPGCHALLLGVSGCGRKSTCRLVAYMMRAQLFEIAASEKGGGYKEVLKRVCSAAATDLLSPAILLVSCAGLCRDTHMWSDISQIMREGTCSGLFTSSELIRIQNILRREHSKKSATPQTIAKFIQHNLHVVITWDINRMSGSPIVTRPVSINGSESRSEEWTRDVFSTLCSQCSVVDHYEPWGQQELSEVAQRWWREKTDSLGQGWISSESQLETLAELVAHVHLSTLCVLDQTQPHLSSLLLSPASFTQCLTMTHTIATSLLEKEKRREERVCLALEKVSGAEEGRRVMEGELTALEPELREVERQLQEREKHIETCQERYKSASQDWSEAKKTIASQTDSVESLKLTVAQKMDQVSSLHSSAMEALSSVTKNSVLEVMSYREPPTTAIPVFNALCMLFDRPQTWEDSKQLLITPNFFESLKFFDKDGVSHHKLRQLRSLLRSPQWRIDSIQHASRAVSCLGLWVAALLDYHHARDIVKPFQDQLATAEEILTKAEVTLVTREGDMLETKVEFRAAQKERNNIRRQRTAIETKIAAVQQRLSEAGRLLSALRPWKSRWEEERHSISTHFLSSPGQAVLVAASVSYLCKVPADRHRELWECWLGYCAGRVQLGCLQETESRHTYHSHQPRVHIQPDLSPTSVLSCEEERDRWSHYASFPDKVALERCVAARKSVEEAFSPLPLVLDPHHLFRQYAHELEQCRSGHHRTVSGGTLQQYCSQANQSSSCVEVLRVSSPDWAQSLCEWEEKRETAVVLILDKPLATDDGDTLKGLWRKRNKDLRDQSSDQVFRLYLVLEEQIAKCPSPIIHSLGLTLLDFNVVDMELSTVALESHLLKLTLRIDHPEYAIRHRALLVDRTFYETQIEEDKERVIVSVLESGSLLECPHIVGIAEESQQSALAAQDNIQDTNKALVWSRSLVDSYRPLSLSSALIFTTAHRLCTKFQYHTFSLKRFQELLTSLLATNKHRRPPDDPAACQEHVVHIQKRLLAEVHHRLKLCMFHRHHILLPLLLALEQLMASGEISSHEYRALGEDSESLRYRLDTLTDVVEKPAWLSHQGWTGVHLLEKLPVFQGLSSSLTSHSEAWKEFSRQRVCLTSPTPLHPTTSLGHYHTLLLWRALCPEKFPKCVEEFVSLVLGPEFTSQGSKFNTQDSINHVLSTVPPHTPVACLIHCESDEERVAGIMRGMAMERGVAYHHMDLVDMGEGEGDLEGWCGEGGWIVIHYSYLQKDPRRTWQQLTDVLKRSELGSSQLWVTVPLSLSADIDSSWPCITIEDLATAHYKDLLVDVRQTVSYSPTPSSGALLPSLRQLLPVPLTREELSDLSPAEDRGQTSASFLYDELQQTNSLLLSLHASLQWVERYCSHDTMFSWRAAQALTEIADNRTPQLWHDLLPTHLASLPSLLAVVQLLHGGLDYLIHMARSGWSLPVELHPLWVFNPRDLLSKVQHWFAEQYEIPPTGVTLLAQVTEVESGSLSHSRDSSVTFHSLSLCGAVWNQDTFSLSVSTSPLPSSSNVCVTLTPVDSHSAEQCHVYQCPVYPTTDQQDTLFHIPFQTLSLTTQAFFCCHCD